MSPDRFRRCIAVGVALLCMALAVSRAEAQAGNGSAYGLFVPGSVFLSLTLPLGLGTATASLVASPIPFVDAPPDDAASLASASVNVSVSNPLLAPVLTPLLASALTTGLLEVETATTASDASSAAEVHGLRVNLLSSILTLGGATSVVSSTASAQGTCPAAPTASGTTSLANVSLSSLIPGAVLSTTLAANPAPNTLVLNVPGLVRLTLNEQTLVTDASSAQITVNAIHLKLTNVNVAINLGGLIGTVTAKLSAEVVVSQSFARFDCTGFVPHADLGLLTLDSPDPVPPGGALTYVHTIGNAGPDSATSVSFQSALAAGTGLVSATPSQGSCTLADPVVCALGAIAPGGSATVTIATTAPATPGTATVTSSVSSAVDDPNPANDATTVDTEVQAGPGGGGSADLSLAKIGSPDPVAPNGSLVYTVTVTNAGPDTATGVEVTDTLPGAVSLVSAVPDQGTCGSTSPVVCALGDLAAGASASIAITVTAPSAGQSLANSATVSSATPDPDPANNQAQATTTVTPPSAGSANLSIAKAGAPDPVSPGGSLVYTITVANAGPDAAAGVQVTDTLPGGVSFVSASPSQGTCGPPNPVACDLGSLATGASATIAITVVAPLSGTSLDNAASVASTVADPDPSDNQVQIATAIGPGSADLAIDKIGAPDPVPAGGTLVYVITVSNAGPDLAQSVQVTDTLPAAATLISAVPAQGSCGGSSPVVCSLGNLAAGASAQVTITVTAPSSGASLANTASVSSATPDPSSANDQVQITTAIASVTPASADLAIAVVGAPDPVSPGAALVYTVTVTNAGPDAAAGVQVTQSLPPSATFVSATPSQGTCGTSSPLVCDLGAIAAGGSATITVTVTAPLSGSSLATSASVSSATADPAPANNQAQATTALGPARPGSAALSLVKTAEPAAAIGGQRITYLITVVNAGPDAATNVIVTDALPAALTVESLAVSQGACAQAASVVCQLGTLDVGGSAIVTIVARVGGGAGEIVNTAAVTSDLPDPDPADNTASAPARVLAAAPIPTLSTWALIACAAILLGFGLRALGAREAAR